MQRKEESDIYCLCMCLIMTKFHISVYLHAIFRDATLLYLTGIDTGLYYYTGTYMLILCTSIVTAVRGRRQVSSMHKQLIPGYSLPLLPK